MNIILALMILLHMNISLGLMVSVPIEIRSKKLFIDTKITEVQWILVQVLAYCSSENLFVCHSFSNCGSQKC